MCHSFLASRQRLERVLDPASEGGSLTLQPGALTAAGYVDIVRREHLQQLADTEESAEPAGAQVSVAEQATPIGYDLFAMWMSTSLELQLAAEVKALRESPKLDDQLQRQRALWNSFRRAVRAFALDEEEEEDQDEARADVESAHARDMTVEDVVLYLQSVTTPRGDFPV